MLSHQAKSQPQSGTEPKKLLFVVCEKLWGNKGVKNKVSQRALAAYGGLVEATLQDILDWLERNKTLTCGRLMERLGWVKADDIQEILNRLNCSGYGWGSFKDDIGRLIEDSGKQVYDGGRSAVIDDSTNSAPKKLSLPAQKINLPLLHLKTKKVVKECNSLGKPKQGVVKG